MSKLDRKIWGPSAWTFLHSCGFAYPENPTLDEREAAYKLISALPYMLPCDECKHHAYQYINCESTGISSPSSSYLDSMVVFSRWIFEFHESVNSRLGKKNKKSFEEYMKEYLSGNPCGTDTCSLRQRYAQQEQSYDVFPQWKTFISIMFVLIIIYIIYTVVRRTNVLKNSNV